MKTLILSLILAASLPAQSIFFNTNYAANLGTVATPTFSPAAGAVSNPTTVTVSSATPATTRTYCITQDGSTPTGSYNSCTNGTLGATTSVTGAVTVKAIGCASGYTCSAAGSATYTIAVTPTIIQRVGGCAETYSGGQLQLNISPAAGNALVVVGASRAALPTLSSSDSGTWQTAISSSGGGGFTPFALISYRFSVPSGITWVKLATTGDQFTCAIAYEVSNISAFDTAPSPNLVAAATSASRTAGPITTNYSGIMFAAFASVDYTVTAGPTGGFAGVAGDSAIQTGSLGTIAATRIAAAGTYTAGWTVTDNTWESVSFIAAFH